MLIGPLDRQLGQGWGARVCTVESIVMFYLVAEELLYTESQLTTCNPHILPYLATQGPTVVACSTIPVIHYWLYALAELNIQLYDT